MHLTMLGGGKQLQSGAGSPLGRSGDTPPKREREGFFSFTFSHSVTLAFTLLRFVLPLEI